MTLVFRSFVPVLLMAALLPAYIEDGSPSDAVHGHCELI